MSGFAVIICSSGASLRFCLYSRSPSPLLRFKFPFTLPSLIHPSALYIRFFSISLSGLWSRLIGKAWPFLHSTTRESPAFAKYIFLFKESITHTQEVHPVIIATSTSSPFCWLSNLFSSSAWAFWFFWFCNSSSCLLFFAISFNSNLPWVSRIKSSIFIKVSVRAFLTSPFFKFSLFKNSEVKCAFTNWLTSFPPCPSNTPNIWYCLFSPWDISEMWASSIRFLHPCIPHEPKRRISFSLS